LSSVGSKIDQEKVVKIAEGMKLVPLIKPYLESVQNLNLKGVNEALNQLYIEEEDWTVLRASIQNHDNFDPLALAKQLKNFSNKDGLFEPRRVAAQLYQRLGRFEESMQLSKDDFNYKEAMKTAYSSNDPEVVEQLLRFFIEKGLFECFAATLYTCYDLVRPDVAMELSWKAGITNLTMPYLIQVMREFNTKMSSISPAPQTKKGVIPSRLTGEGHGVGSPGVESPLYAPTVIDPNFYNPVVLGNSGGATVGYPQGMGGPGLVGGIYTVPGPGGTVFVSGPPGSGVPGVVYPGSPGAHGFGNMGI